MLPPSSGLTRVSWRKLGTPQEQGGVESPSMATRSMTSSTLASSSITGLSPDHFPYITDHVTTHATFQRLRQTLQENRDSSRMEVSAECASSCSSRQIVSLYLAPFSEQLLQGIVPCRGLIACANQNAPHTNNSQFFITMDRCDHLDRKNTIFGKVTGESIYNAMRLDEQEVGVREFISAACMLVRVCGS